ncbi:TPA: threonine-phosphate decarboxylase [bacterium]|nr:threonine-phosphate decarboxylase [bacterium]
MLSGHGGHIQKIIDSYQIPPGEIIDFSSNINPLGPWPRIKEIIKKSCDAITCYPDPESQSARIVLAKYLGVNEENILLGNGSTEFIYLIPQALRCSLALIYCPTFSEYAFSLKLSKIKTHSLFAREKEQFHIDIKKIKDHLPRPDMIILVNPNNPTGYLLKRDELTNLLNFSLNTKTCLLIDETFIEFVGDPSRFSLVKEVVNHKYLLILRSFTKFFSLPGLRIGYLVAHKDLIRKIAPFQPTWSVNSLVQQVVREELFNPNFIKKTREWVEKEKDFLFAQFKEIKDIHPYYSSANFILCKILNKRFEAKSLFLHLLKDRIIIRDCSNFKGLNPYFFRVAVKRRKDNLCLVNSLKKILT